jgi:hypothetical protein
MLHHPKRTAKENMTHKTFRTIPLKPSVIGLGLEGSQGDNNMKILLALLIVAAVPAVCLAQNITAPASAPADKGATKQPTTAPTTEPTTEPAKDPNVGGNPAPGATEKVVPLPGGGKVSIITHNGGRLTNWRPPGARPARPVTPPISGPATQPATQPAEKP